MAIIELIAIVFNLRSKKNGKEPVQLIWGLIISAAISIGSKYLIPLFRRRQYSVDEYTLGKVYIRNVLGQYQPTTTSLVPDQAAYFAQMFFTAGFGVLIESERDLVFLQNNDYKGYQLLKSQLHLFDYKTGKYSVKPDVWNRAVFLKQKYFPLGGNPPAILWDLSNFEKFPYLGPIPDIDDPAKPMNAELPGGVFIKDGYFVNPTPAQAAAIKIAEGTMTVQQAAQMGIDAAQNGLNNVQPVNAASTTSNLKLWLIGAGAGLLYFITRKKRRK